jgi:hypothetical protein
MTYRSPRIYLYKITFEEVPYYYYGVHKETLFDDEYWGTSVTHKWCWNFYTPKKQILEVFSFTDDGWLEALEVEKRLIRPFYNTDKWCLNETCGGQISLNIRRKVGEKSYNEGKGCFSLSLDERKVVSSKSGKKCYENKLGFHGRTKEQMIEDGKKGGTKTYQNQTGMFSITPEKRKEITKEVNSQRWMCLETEYVSNSGGLSRYQKARGIDTSKRVRLK